MDPRVSNACAEAQLSQLSVQCARGSVSVAHTRSLIQTDDGDSRVPSGLTAAVCCQNYENMVLERLLPERKEFMIT
ncbi:hypothetical protein QQF64_001300 [Cirrhinus molitorella]|uniref:Uncharacterized protein n=2 Tax=Cirrhinus molitorella TaxID=172907 RepID=A0ABR3NZN4_9TELE|nr:hypothetical protein Q8A67_004603 [Cirrhinus molitorella]